MSNNKIRIGKIVNTHGIRGELRIIDGPRYGCHHFQDVGYVYIDDKKYKLSKTRPHKAFILITLTEFNNINDVLCFKNKYIEIEKENADVQFDPNEYIGWDVYKDDKKIGKVSTLMQTPAYYIFNLDNGDAIPFTEQFIKVQKDRLVIIKKEG